MAAQPVSPTQTVFAGRRRMGHKGRPDCDYRSGARRSGLCSEVVSAAFASQWKAKKKTTQKARIVLGEKLEPDQSASDLLSAAEALARRGELRAAIRKAYIAL